MPYADGFAMPGGREDGENTVEDWVVWLEDFVIISLKFANSLLQNS